MSVHEKGPCRGSAVGAIERCIELLMNFVMLCGPSPQPGTPHGGQSLVVHVVIAPWNQGSPRAVIDNSPKKHSIKIEMKA
jgi:hypothetical protein